MEFPGERRNYKRIIRKFKSKIKIWRISAEFEGVTENLSQGGAFISSQSWSEFQKDDPTSVSLFLPPEMTGQLETLILRGSGVVQRVEKDKEGIALEFTKDLRCFEVLR